MNWSARGNVLNQYLRNTSIGTTVKYLRKKISKPIFLSIIRTLKGLDTKIISIFLSVLSIIPIPQRQLSCRGGFQISHNTSEVGMGGRELQHRTQSIFIFTQIKSHNKNTHKR